MSGHLNLVLLGPPGAGKGTQAKMMVEKYGVPQISTGDLLRASIASGSELGDKVKSYVTSGGLVPDDLVLSVLLERIGGDDCRQGFILDGFPRTVGQADALQVALTERGMPLKGVIAIIVPDEELVGRLTGRRICRGCGASFHVTFSPPKIADTCDGCGGELYQRKDDSHDVITNRLHVYHEQTSPLIEFYQKQGILQKIDGTGKIGMIFQHICDTIEGLN